MSTTGRAGALRLLLGDAGVLHLVHRCPDPAMLTIS